MATDGKDTNPIPASYYQAPNQRLEHVTGPSNRIAAGAWYRQVPGFRRGTRLNALIAIFAYLVIAAWIIQLPTNPALGILGILSVVAILLAFNVAGLRARLPVFRSSNRVLAAAGWSVVVIAILVAAVFAQPPSAKQPAGNPAVATRQSSPSPESTSPTESPSKSTASQSPSPSPSPSPKPSPSPTPTPSPAASAAPPAPAPTPISILNGPLSAARNSNVTLNVRTAGSTYCTIVVNYSSGPSNATGLTPKTSDPSGNVSWTWKVGGNTTRGTWPITVSCGNNSAGTTITVT